MCAYNGALWDIRKMHCGICEMGLFCHVLSWLKCLIQLDLFYMYSMILSFTLQWFTWAPFSIYGWAWSQPLREDVTYVTSSLIGWDLAQFNWGGWGCEVSCGGHHRPKGKTTTGSALDGAVFDIAQILAYLVHNMSRFQLYLGFGHFGWLPSFFGQ